MPLGSEQKILRFLHFLSSSNAFGSLWGSLPSGWAVGWKTGAQKWVETLDVNCWWVEHPSCYVAKTPQKFFGSFWEKAFLLILFGCFFENLKIFCVSVRVGSWTFLLFLFFWLIGTYRTWHWSSGRWTFLPLRTQHCFRETRKSWMNFKTRVWRSCMGVVGFDVAWFPSTFHPGIW